MATVEVRFSALPAHVRTARLVATAVARRAGVEESLLDEVRLAVGEVCSRAVGLHQQHAPLEPVLLSLSDDDGRFTVTVVDVAPAGEAVAESFDGIDPEALAAPAATDADGQQVGARAGAPTDLLPAGFGLAVVTGLVDDVEVSTGDDGTGTSVRMTWVASTARPPATI